MKSNQFRREVVRPLTEKLLSPEAGELILDVACGTGNFSQRLAVLGADVIAFDFSETMIANVKHRRAALHCAVKLAETSRRNYIFPAFMVDGYLFALAAAFFPSQPILICFLLSFNCFTVILNFRIPPVFPDIRPTISTYTLWFSKAGYKNYWGFIISVCILIKTIQNESGFKAPCK